MKRRIVMMWMATLMVASMVLGSPAQAQETFEVGCSDAGCEGITPPFLGEPFECDQELLEEGEPSECTNTTSGVTFDCTVTEVERFVDPETGIPFVLVRHTCTIPAQAPPGGGDNGGGGGGDNGGGGGGDNGGGGGATPITQEGEQQAEAGEIDQTFDVS